MTNLITWFHRDRTPEVNDDPLGVEIHASLRRLQESIGRPWCRVYWGHAGCALRRGHDGLHTDEHGHHPDPGFMFGEDTTADERSEMD